MDINTCFETTKDYHKIAYYSHLIPIFITIVVSAFVLIKSRFSLLSKVFALFTFTFCAWLLGDVIAWTADDYNFVSFVWSPLDYINIVFYLLGAYFFVVLVKEKDISILYKFLLFLLIFPAWWITLKNQSISLFYQPVCEALNNDFLSEYKLLLEILVIAFIMFYAFFKMRKIEKARKLQIFIVSSALVLFFSIFSVTEYISSQTGVYEINLYSLFVLPVFLFMIVYSITNLEIFKIRLIGTQLLAYVLIIMVGSQFFFLENTTDKSLTIITFIASLGFGILLVRSGRREAVAREKIEKLAVELEVANEQLKELDRQKDELLGIVAHQLAKPITAIRWDLESLLDGDLGQMNEEQKKEANVMRGQAVNLADLVSMILDVSRIQLGKMQLTPQPLNLNEFFTEILQVVEPTVEQKKLNFIKNMSKTLPTVLLDKRYTRMTVENLLTNAVKYTPDGGRVTFDLKIENGIMRCSVSDTGCGIPKEDQGKIFGKMYRASNVRNTVEGNGFGLYVAKGAIEGQGGKMWFTSEVGKGTTFSFELPMKEG